MGGGRGEVAKHKKINKEGVEGKRRGVWELKRDDNGEVNCVGMADG